MMNQTDERAPNLKSDDGDGRCPGAHTLIAKVLIIDDDPDTLTLIAMALRVLGHQPIRARGGREALEILAAQTPDLILLDLMMPEIDGYETLRRIRALPGMPYVPVAVVTASAEHGVEQRVARYGGNAVYRKPITISMLEGVIHRFLREEASRDRKEAVLSAGS